MGAHPRPWILIIEQPGSGEVPLSEVILRLGHNVTTTHSMEGAATLLDGSLHRLMICSVAESEDPGAYVETYLEKKNTPEVPVLIHRGWDRDTGEPILQGSTEDLFEMERLFTTEMLKDARRRLMTDPI